MSAASDRQQLLRAFFERSVGLRVDDARLDEFERVVEERREALGAASVADYLARASAPGEHFELLRRLTITETYFFRNPAQLAAIAAIFADGDGDLEVLSAGCASGEEPYTLSLLASRHAPRRRIAITAIDGNGDALGRARRARYGAWSLRAVPPDVRARHFSADGELAPALRERVRFERRNLARPDPGFWRPERFDVIVCRNVLMYFTRERMRVVLERFARALVRDGTLVLGHAETTRGLLDSFEPCEEGNAFVHRLRSGAAPPRRRILASPLAAAPPAPLGRGWQDRIAASSGRVARLAARPDDPDLPEAPDTGAQLEAARAAFLAERFAEVAARLPAGARDPDSLRLRAAALVASSHPDAEASCRSLLAVEDLDPVGHHLLALCREGAGAWQEAADLDRQAIYLDPSFAMPQLHLGLLLARTGDEDGSRRALWAALDLLPDEDEERLHLVGGGFGRGGLVELCRARLAAGSLLS